MRNCAGCEATLSPVNTYNGITKWCRDCWCSVVKRHRRLNASVREYDRARAKTPARKAKARKVSQKWRHDNPAGYQAQTAVGNAIRDGKLTKEPCLFCGATKRLHAHHTDYSKPLDVQWVCAKCHHRLHAIQNATEKCSSKIQAELAHT